MELGFAGWTMVPLLNCAVKSEDMPGPLAEQDVPPMTTIPFAIVLAFFPLQIVAKSV